jgi:pyrroloquinoline quinone biosynthesis protein B
MIDATPDFRQQLHYLQKAAPGYTLAGILLTHAHIGHYTGLIHLGKEAWNTHELPVYASPAMCDFLRRHAPWSQLVTLNNIVLHELTPDQPCALSPTLHCTPLRVPHRNEWSDTLAFVVQGAQRKLFYCPDINGWAAWEHDLSTFLAGIEVALLDGSFFSPDELPGRDLSQIPHPFVVETAQRLAQSESTCAVQMIHLNHSNPLFYDPTAQAWLHQRGIGVGATGQRWQLG